MKLNEGNQITLQTSNDLYDFGSFVVREKDDTYDVFLEKSNLILKELHYHTLANLSDTKESKEMIYSVLLSYGIKVSAEQRDYIYRIFSRFHIGTLGDNVGFYENYFVQRTARSAIDDQIKSLKREQMIFDLDVSKNMLRSHLGHRELVGLYKIFDDKIIGGGYYSTDFEGLNKKVHLSGKSIDYGEIENLDYLEDRINALM